MDANSSRALARAHPSRSPNSRARFTAWLREVAPSFRYRHRLRLDGVLGQEQLGADLAEGQVRGEQRRSPRRGSPRTSALSPRRPVVRGTVMLCTKTSVTIRARPC